MKTRTVLGKDIKVGDKVIRESDGKVLTIRDIQNGIYRNSRLATYGRNDEWATIYKNVKYEVVDGGANADRA